MQEIYQSDEFVEKFNSDFFDFVSEKTGVESDHIYKVASYTFGTLTANENMKLPLPEWYTPRVKQTFIDIMESIFYDGNTFTPKMKKLGPGFIIKKFVENMNLNGATVKPRKIYWYSAHDDNLPTFIRAHDIHQFRYPPYGSGLVFEKLRDCDNSIYVRILAWMGNGQIKTLKIGSHEEYFPIEDYLKIVDPVIPSDIEIHEMITHVVSEAEIKNILFGNPVIKKL